MAAARCRALPRRAMLSSHGQHYPEFEISDATWDNYQRWLKQIHDERE